jgi:lipoate-protein ligase A
MNMPAKSPMIKRSGSAIRKVPGGKMIRIDVVFTKSLEKVSITGDFFLFPEDALDEVEAALRGVDLPLDPETITATIEEILRSHKAELIGVSPLEITATLQEALR